MFLKILYTLAALLCFAPFISSAMGLIGGMAFAVLIGNPFINQTRKIVPTAMGICIMGLGAEMNFTAVAHTAGTSIFYTAAGILFTFFVGYCLAKALKIPRNIYILISSGTSICGGSAIAAVSPVIAAQPEEMSVSLATVFLLNALALVIFPYFGHLLQLSETQFGLWSALAIHDTSSVVGATLQYGAKALEVGTTVKLTRALWIIPMAFVISLAIRKKNDESKKVKTKIPWFIPAFVALAGLVTLFPALQGPGHYVAFGSRRALVATLFLVGSGLNKETLKRVGLKPFALGLLLWIAVGGLALAAVYFNIIKI